MSARGVLLASLLASLLALSAATSPARADELLDYLESRGLDSLAAMRLEDLAARAAGDERAQLLDRLAELFARMLDAAPDAETQARLLARADMLAADLATQKGDKLRLSAARTRYREAAGVAERIRAGVALDPAPAAESLGVQIDELLRVADRCDKRAAELGRRADRENGIGRDLLSAESDAERGMAGQARFLAAWSMLYRGTLSRTKSDAERADGLFASLLGARDGKLAPGDVSVDLRRDEAYATAILGLALAKSRTQGFSEASRWLDLLAADETEASVRANLPGWRMVCALESGAWAQARAAFDSLAGRDDSANWARVAVARAVEDGGTDPEARGLARAAIAELASRRDLGAVRELVARYGEPILGADGAAFVPRYLRAVKLYEDARAAMAKAGNDAAALASDAVRTPSAEAADALAQALAAGDAKQFEAAATECRLMLAWSLRGMGEGAEAARIFDEIAAAEVGARAEEAAYLAIASVDDAARRAGDAAERRARESELSTRIAAFLARFPGSSQAPALLARKVALTDEPKFEDVARLLAVKPDNELWLDSRKQALGALYRMFRATNAPRVETGRQYLAVLAELPRDARTNLPASSTTIARQALEVTLAPEIRDPKVARDLLAALDASIDAGQLVREDAAEELAYRRLQLAILEDRWADVAEALAPFEQSGATELWAEAALRLALRGAESKRRSTAPDAPERGGYVTTVVRAGDAILARAGGTAKAFTGEPAAVAAMTQFARLALDARVESVASSGNAGEAAKGLPIVDALLATAPRDATLLRANAVLSEAAGELARAADALRALVGGLPARTPAWFDAKLDQVRVLSKLDPVRARAVVDQFTALYPEIGPEPFKARFLALVAALPAKGAEPAKEPRGGEGPENDAARDMPREDATGNGGAR